MKADGDVCFCLTATLANMSDLRKFKFSVDSFQKRHYNLITVGKVEPFPEVTEDIMTATY